MAAPYKEGTAWSFRLRIQGEDIYRRGFGSEAAARKELNQLQHTLNGAGKPARQGPWRTTLAQALRDYALERLPALKGAKQDACRINRYLRLAGLATLKLVPAKGAASDKPEGALLWQIEDVPPKSRQKIPKGLAEHRKEQAHRTEGSDKQRQKLARMFVADVQAYELQKLVDVMLQDGYSAATISLERAMLSSLFTYARESWRWAAPSRNPGKGLKLPKIDNSRSRVLSNKEWQAIGTALESCKNAFLAPALALLLESAMRCSEALVGATWGDFDAERCILRLREAKAGWRDVPLNPGAMDVMRGLQAMAREEGTDALLAAAKILPLTYEALKAGWQRACQRADVQGVNLHDLRHTSATRFALELNGNLPILKVITGHKTTSQLMRYINVKPDDVVRLLHGRPLSEDSAPAGMRVVRAQIVKSGAAPHERNSVELSQNVLPFVRRAAGLG